MPTDLHATLQALTAQPSTEHPYLSIYLDWQPDGNGQRPSLQALQQELDLIATRLRERDASLDSFNTDQQRIMEYLENEAPADAHSIAIFACDAESVWEALPLQVPVETRIVEDRYPHTFRLAQVLDDHETYAVVLVDGQESRILLISMNEAEVAGSAEASEDIKRFQAGGWAQMIFQRRTDNIIKAHTKDMADKLGRIIKRYKVQHVIIAGNDSIKGIVRDSLPKTITDMLVDYINLDITADLQSIIATLEPMMRDVELEQEANALAELVAEVNGQNLGVVGVGETAMALTKGQVRTLIMHQGFVGSGSECPNCGTLRAGIRPQCPYDGADMSQVDLREVFTARALQTSAEIQIVEASEFLDEHEGVGAVLRWRESEQAQTA